LASATDALVFVTPEVAGPTSSNYGYWVLWPPGNEPDGANRILSVLTGMDWEGTGADLVFGLHEGHYLSAASAQLRARGYFMARSMVLQEPSAAIGTAGGFGSPIPLFLALDGRSPEATPLSMRDHWPSGVVFAAAESWERVAAIAAKAGGRVLVLEYPPPAGRRWSRYWLRGVGWGDHQPMWNSWKVPGLIPASQTGNLLIHPYRFKWVPNDSGNWGGAGIWLSFVSYASPLTFAILGFVVAFFVGCAVYLISIEERPRFAGTTLKYLLLIPAAILFAGDLNRLLGAEWAWVWLVLALFSLVFASQIVGAFSARALRGVHPAFAIAIVGFASTAASQPLWSMYSNLFGLNTLPLSPEAAAALLGYLVAICAFGRGNKYAQWIGPFLAGLTLAWGIVVNPWWVSGQWPFVALPFAAVVASEGLFRLWLLPFFAALPLADGRLIHHGFVWAPGNLYPSFGQSGAVNLARDAEFLVSHGFLATLLIGGGIAIFVERYLFHEIRRTMLRDSRDKPLFFASFLCVAMGLFQPLMLYPALMCFVGGAFVVLSDTAQAV